MKSLGDGEARVRFFAAQSLGKLGNAASAEPLLALLRANDNKDAYLRFVASHALSQLHADSALAAGAKDPSAAVRLGVLLAYRYTKNPAIAHFLGDSDAFIVREAAEAINDVPVEPALNALADKLVSAPAADQALVLRALNANYRLGETARAQAVADYALNDKATPEMRAEALQQLGLWGNVPQRDRIVGIYRPMKARAATDAASALTPAVAKLLDVTTPEPVQLAALDAVGSLDLRAAAPVLVATVGNEQAAESVRSAALKQLDGFGGDEVLKAVSSAEKSKVPALRLAALQIMAHRAPERALPLIKQFRRRNRAGTAGCLPGDGAAATAQAAPLLVGALDQLAAGKVQPGAQVELLEAVEKSSAPAVKTRWEKQQAAWKASGDALAPYRFALAGGDPQRGSNEFFQNAVLPCARCHKVFGEGGEAGPNLSRVGAQHPIEYLLESVVRPNAHIAQGFDLVNITMANGDTESGSVVSESASQIVLKRGDGSQLTLDPKQVKQRVTAPSSMPEIYAQVLTRAQLRDVVAFLHRLDNHGGPAAPPEESFGSSNRAMQSAPKEGPAGGHP